MGKNELYKLLVYNLPIYAGAVELRNFFGRYGLVTKALIMFDWKTGIPTGVGIVTFKEKEAYLKALEIGKDSMEGRNIKFVKANK